jgi:hypothetical protein
MIFVFGSNEAGIHGAGSALDARRKHGAVYKVGVGRQGQSYGIPTCAVPSGSPGWEIPFEKVVGYVDGFIAYARANSDEFMVTRVGCGFAGWTDEQMAPLFALAPDNCWYDTQWRELLGGGKKYWGTWKEHVYHYTPEFRLAVGDLKETV